MRRPITRLALLALSLLALAATARAEEEAPARPLDKVTFGLNWAAEAEYGGFYQAAATGLYAKHGLDVTIRQGGPQVNHMQMLLAGRIDFNLASNSFLLLNLAKENIPFRAVASVFQKNPAVLIAHPGQDNDDFASLKGKPILIGSDTRVGWWNFLKAKYGYTDAQIRPYTFNLTPFLSDRKAIQQGLIGSEPFSIKEALGHEPVVLLVADSGFNGYAWLIATSDRNINERPDLVQRFVDATMEGWYSYLHGDPTPGDALIRKENPEMTQALLDYSRETMNAHGIIDSGDAGDKGIGAMTDERWAAVYAESRDQGLYPAGLDVTKAYTLQFVNKGPTLKAAGR